MAVVTPPGTWVAIGTGAALVLGAIVLLKVAAKSETSIEYRGAHFAHKAEIGSEIQGRHKHLIREVHL